MDTNSVHLNENGCPGETNETNWTPQEKYLYDILIKDSILDVSFEVHRAVKLGYEFLYPSRENEGVNKRSSKKKKKEPLTCPSCTKKKAAEKYSQHLSQCLLQSSEFSRPRKETKYTENDSDASQDDKESESEQDSDEWGSKKILELQAFKQRRISMLSYGDLKPFPGTCRESNKGNKKTSKQQEYVR